MDWHAQSVSGGRETVITSRTNPLIKELRALRQRKERDRKGAFFVEGIQPVLHALAAGADIELILVALERLTSPAARDAVRVATKSGRRIVQVSASVLESLCEREEPTGLAAVVRYHPASLDDLRIGPDTILTALYEIRNPGNLGSIIRTCDAVGSGAVILIGATTDPYHPTAVKASRGAIFTVPLVHLDAAEELIEWCSRARVRLVTAHDKAEQDVWTADLSCPLVCLFGGEGEGLPSDITNAGTPVRIPMAGAVDSLNVSVAAGILLYEARRRLIALKT